MLWIFILHRNAEAITVVTAPNIETALLSLNDSDDAERRKTLQQKTKMLDLEASQTRMEERRRFREKLKEALKKVV